MRACRATYIYQTKKPVRQRRGNVWLFIYSHLYTTESLKGIYEGFISGRHYSFPKDSQLDYRKRLEVLALNWTKEFSVYRKIQLFVEDLVHALLNDARKIGVEITPEQEEQLLQYLRLRFQRFYPLPRRGAVKRKESGE